MKKKYYFVSGMAVIKNEIMGKTTQQIINAVIEKHPLEWQLEHKEIVINFFSEVPEDAALKFIEAVKKPNIVKPENVISLKENK